jgi:F0F1-type ATP synthase assembly protein I
MATLVKCIECGGLVSSQASQCPRCTTNYPLGVKCIVCSQTLKRSVAIKITKEYGGAENRISIKFFHRDCHAQVSQVKLSRSRTSCPVCKLAIEFDTGSSVTCHNCGHNFSTKLQDPSLGTCCYCGFHLNKNLEVKVKEVSRQFLTGWVNEPIYAHRLCYTKERQEQERKLLKKETIAQEYGKKKRSSESRKKQASRNRETLFLSIALGLVVGIIIGGLGGVVSHFVWGVASSWISAALFGSTGVFIVTIVAVWILSIFE